MRGKLLFVVELIVLVGVFYLDWIGRLPVSKTPYLFILGWISLRIRGLGWRDVGLTLNLEGRAPSRPINLLIIGIIAGIGMEALELFATQPLLTKLLNKGPDLPEMQELVGSWKLLILFLGLTWTLAAFGEEMVWRGYVMNRFADLFGRSRAGWIASAVLISFLFGLAHFPQGPTGVIENIIDGAILAALYFATGRNLWAPIIAHGIQDTVDVLLIYLGQYPDLRPEMASF
jgi:uncharacterized protein